MAEITAVNIPVTQSSSLSVEGHTVKCVGGSELLLNAFLGYNNYEGQTP